MKEKCNLNKNADENRARVNQARGLELVNPQELRHYVFSYRKLLNH